SQISGEGLKCPLLGHFWLAAMRSVPSVVPHRDLLQEPIVLPPFHSRKHKLMSFVRTWSSPIVDTQLPRRQYMEVNSGSGVLTASCPVWGEVEIPDQAVGTGVGDR